MPKARSFFSEDASPGRACRTGSLPPVEGLVFGNPNGLTSAEKDKDGDVLRAWADANRGFWGSTPSCP